MDDIDYAILSLLQSNARTSYTEISKNIHLSVPSVIARINNMVDSGIIIGNTIVIDNQKIGNKIRAIVCVDVNFNKYENFKKFCFDSPYITESHRVVGVYNAIIKIAVEDTYKFEKFIDEIKDFGTCLTSIITTTYFRNRLLPRGNDK